MSEVQVTETWRVWWHEDHVRFAAPWMGEGEYWVNWHPDNCLNCYWNNIKFDIPEPVPARIKELHEQNRPLAEDEFRSGNGFRCQMRMVDGRFEWLHRKVWISEIEKTIRDYIRDGMDAPDSWPLALAYYLKRKPKREVERRTWAEPDTEGVICSWFDGQRVKVRISAYSYFYPSPDQAREIAAHLLKCANAADGVES